MKLIQGGNAKNLVWILMAWVKLSAIKYVQMSVNYLI